MIRRPPRSTRVRSSAASDVYKRPPYPTALVDWVPEPKSVAALMFCQAVIAFRPGVRIPRQNARFYSWPPRLDGGGQAVRLGRVGRSGALVEAVEAGPDDVAFGVRTRQTKQATKLLLDRIGLKNHHPGVTGVDQRIPHLRKGFRTQTLVPS